MEIIPLRCVLKLAFRRFSMTKCCKISEKIAVQFMLSFVVKEWRQFLKAFKEQRNSKFTETLKKKKKDFRSFIGRKRRAKVFLVFPTTQRNAYKVPLEGFKEITKISLKQFQQQVIQQKRQFSSNWGIFPKQLNY